MDKNWAEKAKEINKLLGNKNNYKEAIDKLIDFRAELLAQVRQFVNDYPAEAFSQMPYPNAEGYHSKTLSYSIWHIFRIEDIVAHELIARDTQVLFRGDFQQRIGAPIITTGNELAGQEIVEFSEKLDVRALLEYAETVMESTNEILRGLDYAVFKNKSTPEERERLENSGCVSEDAQAVWLIEYWCGKDVRGLIKMPFSRHWIMHIEAMRRIEKGIK